MFSFLVTQQLECQYHFVQVRTCYLFRYYCNYEYTSIISYGNLIGIPLDDDCGNTFNLQNNAFGFPNSSQDYDYCFDYSGIFELAIASYAW